MSNNIVATSNYDNEMFFEYIAVNGKNIFPKMLDEILATMNNSRWKSDEVYYQIKPHDYELKKFEP